MWHPGARRAKHREEKCVHSSLLDTHTHPHTRTHTHMHPHTHTHTGTHTHTHTHTHTQEKKSQQERAREERIADGEAQSALNNPRLIEREQLTDILNPLGLVIKDVPADGHCLYAAVQDQLSCRVGVKVRGLCYLRGFKVVVKMPNELL